MSIVDDKLQNLNPKDYDMPGDKARIEQWRRQAEDLDMQASFVQHPVAMRLAAEAKKKIAEIDFKLQNDEDLLLNPNRAAERAGMLREKKVHQLYLQDFGRNVQQEIDALAKSIDTYRFGD